MILRKLTHAGIAVHSEIMYSSATKANKMLMVLTLKERRIKYILEEYPARCCGNW